MFCSDVVSEAHKSFSPSLGRGHYTPLASPRHPPRDSPRDSPKDSPTGSQRDSPTVSPLARRTEAIVGLQATCSHPLAQVAGVFSHCNPIPISTHLGIAARLPPPSPDLPLLHVHPLLPQPGEELPLLSSLGPSGGIQKISSPASAAKDLEQVLDLFVNLLSL